MESRKIEREMKHFSHEHNLWPIRWSRTGFRCSMCNCADIPGEDSGYGCFECLYFLNKTCGDLPQHFNHLLHPQHPLTLAKRSIHNISCYYCEKPFEDEYIYGCEECALYMHMKCAMIPLPTIKSEDGDGQVQYLCHGDSMKLVEDDESRGEAKCFACQSVWSGPAYSCAFEKCGNFLHKSCVDKLRRQIERHPFHPRHFLMLQVSKPRSCRSCCKKECRLVFGCQEGCNFNMCTECIFLETTVKCRSHDHLISLVEKAYCDIQCDACGKSYKKWPPNKVVPDEVVRTRSLLFRCMECDFNLHFLCGPLPTSIKYEYHIDHLNLVDYTIDDDYSDKDEYYCDACEEERDPHLRIYSCADCKYTAHIHCVISEIMEVIKGDTEDFELEALGENRWHFEIEHSVFHQTKEAVSLEPEKVEVQGGVIKELTLRDIIDALTKQEKQKLIDPFDFDHPSADQVDRIKKYHDYAQLNSRFFEGERLIADVEKIQQFFSFESSEYSNFLGELRWFAPAEGLKLDDRYLRQKVVDVNGYVVPKTLAQILRTLTRKHGDLGGDSSLTPEMKSTASTLLCIAVDRMCRTDVKDVTKDDLKQWYFYLQGVSKITGFKTIIDLGSFEELIVKPFLGLEAIRCEEELNEKLE